MGLVLPRLLFRSATVVLESWSRGHSSLELSCLRSMYVHVLYNPLDLGAVVSRPGSFLYSRQYETDQHTPG